MSSGSIRPAGMSRNAFRCAICGHWTEPGGMCACTATAGPDDGEDYLEALACSYDRED